MIEKYNEMTNERAHFCSELKRGYNFWERKLNNVSQEIQGTPKSRKRDDSNTGFTLEDPPDGIIETLNFADTDFFRNIRKLFFFFFFFYYKMIYTMNENLK